MLEAAVADFCDQHSEMAQLPVTVSDVVERDDDPSAGWRALRFQLLEAAGNLTCFRKHMK